MLCLKEVHVLLSRNREILRILGGFSSLDDEEYAFRLHLALGSKTEVRKPGQKNNEIDGVSSTSSMEPTDIIAVDPPCFDNKSAPHVSTTRDTGVTYLCYCSQCTAPFSVVTF